MADAPAYARLAAVKLVHQWRNKRLFGRPYLKLGQCLGLSGYLFELGGILGAKYAGKLDAFGSAFLGGPPDVQKSACIGLANKLLSANRLNESTTFFDFVQTEYGSRMGHKEDASEYCLAHMSDRIPVEIAAEFGWQCAVRGVAVAAIHPEMFRAMFERTYVAVPKEEWQAWYAAGLDIGPEQPRRSYPEAEEAENNNFVEYCREHRPDLYTILITST